MIAGVSAAMEGSYETQLSDEPEAPEWNAFLAETHGSWPFIEP